MATVTIADINDAIADTFADVSSIRTVQSYNELSEGLNRGDLPLAQAYWDRIEWDQAGGTDRSAFQGGVRQKVIQFNIDVYAAVRSHIDENMADTIECLDDAVTVMEQQNTRPFFGISGIKAFEVQGERTVFEYASGTTPQRYMGIQFILRLYVY